jgi:hypothetical protein
MNYFSLLITLSVSFCSLSQVNNGYYGKTYGSRSLMHRDVWEHYKRKIPKGHDIHHKNHDKTDNRIENLELYTKTEHAKLFATGNNQHGKKN